MKTQQFLAHHGISANPFAEEDAQTDPVFKEFCIGSTYHPAWDKVFGDPAEPATAVVFGEKGSGKTALRLQIARRLADHNRAHPEARVFVIEYDDFNPFLDRFRERIGSWRRADRVLQEWKLWDHMDAILSLGVTSLAESIVERRPLSGSEGEPAAVPDVSRLDHRQIRDLLLLAACYDRSAAEPLLVHWNQLRRKLRFRPFRAWLDVVLAVAATLGLTGFLAYQQRWGWLSQVWFYLALLACWLPWIGRSLRRLWQAWSIARSVRVGKRQIGQLQKVLMRFPSRDILGQPLPARQRTDDRYELFGKFQGLLRSLGCAGVVVIVDRVDEPHLINGSAEQMRTLIWPMLDNKFLKHPGIGFKLLLPIELVQFLDRADRAFYERARLDKQNLVPSLEWTPEALYDLANERIKACSPGGGANLHDLFDEAINDRRLMDAFRMLRVPRHLFKFMYRLLVAHCNAFSEEAPSWRISSERFESVLAVYLRDQDEVERGLRAG